MSTPHLSHTRVKPGMFARICFQADGGTDYAAMDSATLEADLMGDGPAADAAPDDEQAAQQEGEAGVGAGTVAPEQDQDPNQQGAKRTVPVSEHMEERKRRQALEAELATIRAQQAARDQEAAQQRQFQEANAEYQRLLEDDPEAAAVFAANYYARQDQTRQETARQQATLQTLQTAAEVGVEVYGQNRFVGAIQRLYNEFGVEWVDRKAAEQGSAVKAAKWAVEFAESKLAPDEATFQQRVQTEAQKLAQEILAKQQQPHQGHQTIGLVSSGTTQPPAVKPARKMSDKELERSLVE